MGNETLLLNQPQEHLVVPEYDEFGSLPDSYLMTHYGITSEEGRQVFQFGEYNGTLAQMVNEIPDPVTGKVCPMGSMVRKAHDGEGSQGVQRVVDGAKMMGAEGDITIAPKFQEDYARVKAQYPKKKVIRQIKLPLLKLLK